MSSIQKNLKLKTLQTHRILLVIWTSGLRVERNQKLSTSLFDKRDDLNFPIVNFPFIGSNIPAFPAYGVFVSQLICYARASSRYQDFIHRGCLLTNKLLGQGYLLPRLKTAFKKFYGRHHDLVDKYDGSMTCMATDLLAVQHG